MKLVRRRPVDPDRDPGASMALLREVLNPPLDPGYASWAKSREAAGMPRSTGSRTVLLFVSMLVLGFLITVAAQTLRAPDPAAAATRAGLRERIEATSQLGDEHVEQLATLRQEIAALERAQVPPEDDQQEGEGAALQAGATPVVGEGVVLTLNDPPVTADREEGERVLARDLQVIVNGLWAHGAEAIAINEQRLTSTSTIRFAGQAIVVDLRGLARPYVVQAIGPREALEQELRSGATGNYLAELRSDFNIVVELTTADQLTVPAGSRLSTRVASVPDTDATTQEAP